MYKIMYVMLHFGKKSNSFPGQFLERILQTMMSNICQFWCLNKSYWILRCSIWY